MRKKASALVVVLALLFSEVVLFQFATLAKANPYHFPPFYPETPNRDPPILTVESPVSVTYYTNEIPLNFTVTQHDSWFQNNLTLVVIQRIDYLLDGKVVNIWSAITNSRSPLSTTTPFSTILNVSRGQHTLEINVAALSFYDPVQKTDWHFLSYVDVVASKTIFFTVAVDTSIPEVPSWIFLPLFLIVTLVAIFCSKTLRVHPRRS
jgi:hypothetical protein